MPRLEKKINIPKTSYEIVYQIPVLTSQWHLGICLSYLEKDTDIQNLIKIFNKIYKKNTCALLYFDNNIKMG